MILLDISSKLLSRISLFSIALPLICSLYPLILRRFTSYSRPFFILLLITFIFELFALYLNTKKSSNLYVYFILTYIECFGYSYIYYKNITNKKFQFLIGICYVFFLIFSAFYIIQIGSFNHFNSEMRVIESFSLIVFSMIYLYILSNEISKKPINILQTPMFWYSIGILFYFTANFFMFLFYNRLTLIIPQSWVLHSVVNILCNCIFAISFLCKAK